MVPFTDSNGLRDYRASPCAHRTYAEGWVRGWPWLVVIVVGLVSLALQVWR